MFIRSTLLITLVSVGVAGCQHGRSNSSTPLTTASILNSGNAKLTHSRLSQSADSDIPAPVPTVTASTPSPQPMAVSDGELENLTVQPYPDSIPAPAPNHMSEDIAGTPSRRGILAPIGSAVSRIAGLSSSESRQPIGRSIRLGRKVIASRSRSRTHRIIVEDDLTSDNYELDTGDRIRVSVFEQRNLSRIYTVDAGGFISVPLIGSISVRGETTSMVERSIADSLSQKYIKDPKVSVEINTYRPFYILGQVRNSGSFPFVNGMTVRSAVAVAGGYTARANKRKVMLTRRLNKKRITTYVQPGYYIRPGDTLEIRERFF